MDDQEAEITLKRVSNTELLLLMPTAGKALTSRATSSSPTTAYRVTHVRLIWVLRRIHNLRISLPSALSGFEVVLRESTHTYRKAVGRIRVCHPVRTVSHKKERESQIFSMGPISRRKQIVEP